MNLREYWFDEFHLRVSARVLERNGISVPLGAKAFDLLTHLVQHAGGVVSKEELIKAVWHNSHVDESNLTQQVLALRKALGDRSGYVVTIPGRGYQFTSSVREIVPSSALFTGATEEIFTQTIRERSRVLIEEPLPGLVVLPVKTPSHRRWLYMGALVIAVIAGIGTSAWMRGHRTATDEFHSVVVADFANTTGDGSFDQFLKRALEIEMGQSPNFNVISGGETVSLLQSMGQKPDTPLKGDVAREICERASRQILVSGDIARVGQRYLLTLEATDCHTGKRLADAKVEANSKEEVLESLDTVADEVRSKLGESAKSQADYEAPIIQVTTPSLEAWKAYAIAATMDDQGKDEAEIAMSYQRATELDPKFAMAWGGLANAHYNQGQEELASEEYKRAFDLSGNISTHEKLLLRAHYYGEGVKDVPEAMKAYRLWANTFPHDWAPLINICNGYVEIGQPSEALPACEQGLAMQPNRAISYSVLIRALMQLNRFVEAKAVGQRAVEHGKDSVGVHAFLYKVAAMEHDQQAITHETRWADEHSDSWYAFYFPYMQALAAATEGRYKEAAKLFQISFDAAKRENLPEDARDILLDEARTEFNLGLPEAARKTLQRVSPADLNKADDAFLSAELGDTKVGERFLAAHRNDPHPATLDTYLNEPEIQSALAMQRGKPLEAIAALEPSRPYELVEFDAVALRAEAYMKSGQASQAILEYQKILKNQGADSISPVYPLAYFGLARAYAVAGETNLSRTEYQNFIEAWKNADPNMPALKAAKAELAKLKR